MKLGEITSDYEIGITVVHKGTRAAFTSKPAFAEGDTLYVYPFMHGKTMLSFAISQDTKIEMTAFKEKEIPFYWRAVWITKGERNGRAYHVIHSKFDGAHVNRRSSLRVQVGTYGSVTDIIGGKPVEVRIRDISATGIGFFLPVTPNLRFARGSRVRVMYSDPESNYKVDVFARVVRVQTRKDQLLYGCAFTRVYTEIARYIAAKQYRKRLNAR